MHTTVSRALARAPARVFPEAPVTGSSSIPTRAFPGDRPRALPLPRLPFLLLPVLLLSGPFSASVDARLQAQEDPLAGVDAFVARVLEEWDAPGLALAVVRGDSVILARGYGVKEVGRNDPLTEYSLFAVASTTKAFTAASLAMLVDEGMLSWDDRVIDLLPGFRLRDPWVTRELTVRDLLSHRSGLPRGDRLWYASPFRRDEVVRRVRFLERRGASGPATATRTSCSSPPGRSSRR